MRAQKQVQQDTGGNGTAAAKRAPAPVAFRRRPVDSDEFKQQRAESEAEAERNRKRSGQSASFASLYGTKVGWSKTCGGGGQSKASRKIAVFLQSLEDIRSCLLDDASAGIPLVSIRELPLCCSPLLVPTAVPDCASLTCPPRAAGRNACVGALPGSEDAPSAAG